MHGNTELTAALINLPVFHAEWVLWLLLVLSIMSIAVMLERWFFFRRRAIDVRDVHARFEVLLSVGDYRAAAELLDGFDSFETNVALTGLRMYARGPDAVEDGISGARAVERLRFSRGLSFLATVGSNAPFIGLFGTVLGIIRAFNDLSANMSQASTAVMSGISEALVATAVGLLVAIPAVVAYNALSGRVSAMVANASLLSHELLSQLKAEV